MPTDGLSALPVAPVIANSKHTSLPLNPVPASSFRLSGPWCTRSVISGTNCETPDGIQPEPQALHQVHFTNAQNVTSQVHVSPSRDSGESSDWRSFGHASSSTIFQDEVAPPQSSREKVSIRNCAISSDAPHAPVDLPHGISGHYDQRIRAESINTSPRPWSKYGLMGLLVAQCVTVAAVFGSTYSTLDPEKARRNVSHSSVYMIIFVIANIFAIIIALDALLYRNLFQLVALCVFNIGMCIDSIVLTRRFRDVANVKESNELKIQMISVPTTTAITSILLIAFTVCLAKEFEWDSFKQMGADIQLQSASRIKNTFFMLQKFNLFFIFGFSLEYQFLTSSAIASSNVVSAAVLTFNLIIITLAITAVDKEIRWMMYVYYVFWIIGVISSCYIMGNKRISTTSRLLVFDVPTILLAIGTGIISIFCHRNFGKGLKESTSRSPWISLFRTTPRKSYPRISMD